MNTIAHLKSEFRYFTNETRRRGSKVEKVSVKTLKLNLIKGILKKCH